MSKAKENRVVIICLISLIILISSVFFWNYISDLQAKKKDAKTEEIDVSKANNVASVDAKLGSDVKITQGYLINYAEHKTSIWYMSDAYVKKVVTNKDSVIITLIDENNANDLDVIIDKEKCEVKTGDKVYFVGTVNLKNNSLNLVKISTDPIEYNNKTDVKYDDLVKNLNELKISNFIINGYLVTDGEKYKLFESKEAYKKDSSYGTYFELFWNEEFNYTGNAEVTVKCSLYDTYQLNNCEILKK